jgi:hypothetical protein
MLFGGMGLAACYFLFAGEFSIHELIAGVFAWGAALSFSALVHHCADRRFKWTRLAWVCGRVLRSVATETWVVAGVLSRVIRRRPAGAMGITLRQPFNHADDTAPAAGRRALVTLAGSIAPQEFVLDIPEHGDWLWVHSLSPSPRIKDREWPV